jgi:hypothetical protein
MFGAERLNIVRNVLDEKDISTFGFINPSWGYGLIGMDDDPKI